MYGGHKSSTHLNLKKKDKTQINFCNSCAFIRGVTMGFNHQRHLPFIIVIVHVSIKLLFTHIYPPLIKMKLNASSVRKNIPVSYIRIPLSLPLLLLPHITCLFLCHNLHQPILPLLFSSQFLSADISVHVLCFFT